MTQQEYSALVAGQLSPSEIEDLTERYGSDLVSTILKGEKNLQEVLQAIADQRESRDTFSIDWDPKQTLRRPWFFRYTKWIILAAIAVIVATLAAVLPRLSSLSADTDFSLTDPLPITIAVVLVIGVGAMLALERSGQG